MNFAIDTFNKERFGLVTGSKCSVLFPLKGEAAAGKKTYAKTLANELFFNHYDEKGSWQTEHGKMGEHFAMLHYQQYYGSDVKEGRWIKNGYCGGTIDAEIPNITGIDFKCPTSLNAWLDYLHEGISKEQKDQCQMYMYLTGYGKWEIAAYLTETQFMNDNGLTYPVPEEKRMIRIMVDKDPTFEERLLIEVELLIAKRDEYLTALNKAFKS